jgi:hypothetical protein
MPISYVVEEVEKLKAQGAIHVLILLLSTFWNQFAGFQEHYFA